MKRQWLGSALLAVAPVVAACAPGAPADQRPAPALTSPGVQPGPTPTVVGLLPAAARARKPALRAAANWNYDFSPHPGDSRFDSTHFARLHQLPIFGADPWEVNVDPKYGAAESWEYSPDGKGLTLKVRKGLKFHNGDPVTAEDVKFSFELRASEPAEVQIAGTLRAIGLERIDVVDDATLKIFLKAPSPIFVAEFSPMINPIYVVSKRHHSNGGMLEADFDAFRAKPLGAGPYRYVKHEPQQFITLEAAEKDPLVGAPLYDRLEFRNIRETGTRLALLRTGQLDIAETTRDQAEPLRREGIRIAFNPTARIIGLYIFQTHLADSYTRFEDVRKAVAYAIDHKLLGETIFKGIGIEAWGCTWPPPTEISAQNPRFREACATPYPYDPIRARQHLAAAGFKPGEVTLKLQFWNNYPEEADLAEAMQPMLQAVGINAAVDRIDRATSTRLRNNEGLANTILFFGPGGRLTALSGAHSVWGPEQGYGPKDDKDVIAALGRATAAPNLDAYMAAMAELGLLIHRRAYGPGFFTAAALWGVRPDTPDWGLERTRGRGPLNLVPLVTDLKP